MFLKVYSPVGTVLEKEISKITFQALDGAHTFLEHHADYISELAPDIIFCYPKESEEPFYLACNRGVIVKQGEQVVLSVRLALTGDDLKTLEEKMKQAFHAEEEERKELNAVMARLEAGLNRSFMNLRGEIHDPS